MKVLMRRLFLTAIIIFSAIGTTRAQMLALKSDALPYAAFAPNLGAELVTSNKTTVSLEAMFAYRSFGTNIRALAFSPEFRYYFHGRPMTREFIGVSAVGATYKWYNDEGKTFKGNVGGLGVTFGYVWRLGEKQRWNMEVRGGLGLYRYNQLSRYAWEGSQDEFSERGWVVLPYKVGLAFSYILPTEKKEKKK